MSGWLMLLMPILNGLVMKEYIIGVITWSVYLCIMNMIIPLYLKDTVLSKTYKCFRVPARVTMVVLFTLTMAKLLTAKSGCEG